MITPRSRRWTGTCAVALAVLGSLTATGTPAAASPVRAGPAEDTVRRMLHDLVRKDGFPAALAAVQDRDGRTRHHSAGVADLKTGAKAPADGYVRIGSNTKTFTAVVVLQLVGEGRVRLDEPVETYLPGLLRGEGVDGRRITVRQLLQHTSGLPEYTDRLATSALSFRHTYFQPRRLLDMALEKKATFAPGTRRQYSNTNYIVAGLLIEQVTGRPVIEEIIERTIRRIGLRHTYFPNVGDERIRTPHAKGYHQNDPQAPMTDATRWDPSAAWAAGQMISTLGDLNRFFTALLGGELLKPEQLEQMRTTVEAPEMGRGGRYGLGLSSITLSCGGRAWGHGGTFPGYYTANAATDDGRAAAIAVTHLPADASALKHVEAALDTALCAKS
ncbi:serine hydrolase domain-containing protein [Planobispora rosea]|uniref:serine hydrolase domain-containing protein n=1 Tax=Planobispora rosea TaxID=35762 RepID=UPI00083A6979|nr:serine hydrolase domain-containing protein [Planobispora rosea]